MFTGIVEELGRVERVERGPDSVVLHLHGPTVVADAAPGASIAVNGVCLTVTGHDTATFTVDVMQESLDRSSLGALQPGSPVNLERAMRADGRFGGHVVQGHVDATTTCLGRTPGENWEVVTFALPPALAPVSYTHLDVYKRQWERGAGSSAWGWRSSTSSSGWRRR